MAKENVTQEKTLHRRSNLKRAGIIAGIAVGSLLLLFVAALVFITFYLTPDRLSSLVSTEAGKNLKADVKAVNVRFTLWSTFPHFCVECDSISVRSRTLDSISPDLARQLPAGYDRLGSCGRFKGGINVLQLMAGRISLRNVEVEHLTVNLVAVNDTINNYLIIPTGSQSSSIPYFTANEVHLANPGKISYFSLATETSADMDLADLELKRKKKSHDSYDFNMSGNITSVVSGLTVLNTFPFRLDGAISLKFKPFSIRMHDYNVKLGNTSGKVSMDVDLGKEMTMNNFSYRLNSFRLLRLLEYLPGLDIAIPRYFKADITLDAAARLTAPWHFSTTTLPSLEVDFRISDGDAYLTLSDNKSYAISHKGMRGIFIFDGESPGSSYFRIPEFTVSGMGIEASASAMITHLMDDPMVEADLAVSGDLEKTTDAVEILRPYSLKGDFLSNTSLKFKVCRNEKGSLDNIDIGGDIRILGFNFTDNSRQLKADAGAVALTFNGNAAYLSDEGLNDGMIKVKGKAGDVLLRSGGFSLATDSLSLLTGLSEKAFLSFPAEGTALPFDIDLNALNLKVRTPSDTTAVNARDIALKGRVNTYPRRHTADAVRMTLSGKSLSFAEGSSSIMLRDINAVLRADALKTPARIPVFHAPDSWFADSAMLSRLDHTPAFITASVPHAVRKFIDTWKTSFDLKVGGGSLSFPSFPADTRFSNLDLAVTADSIALRNLDMSLQGSPMNMKGTLSNIRQFLESPGPAPLRLGLDLNIDTLSINKLAHTYEKGQSLKKVTDRKGLPDKKRAGGNAGNASARKSGSASGGFTDTTTFLIPRNLTADINLSAKETRYTNLRLYDLKTKMNLADGVAKIDSLDISADFGRAFMHLYYDSADARDISVSTGVGVMDINVVGFFQNFHALLMMMPQMHNLSGDISAQLYGKVKVFPDMYLDVPSLWADAYVQGRDLVVKQSSFIRRITKMMLIADGGPIHIANMDVHASVHDNLLELYPFNFEFNNYKLRMEGVNNYDGQLYYHIGVDKSAVPFPFGINITGWFHHPGLHFGGVGYNNYRGEKIAASVMEKNRVNLIKEVSRYMKEFIHKAAESDE